MRTNVVLALLCLALVADILYADNTIVSDEGDEVVFRQVRSTRGKGNRGRSGGGVPCRYSKGTWSECDATTNTRTRTMTLKKGDQGECEASKVENRKCKKACRYVKGDWTECTGGLHMKERLDQLKPGSDSSCEPTRRMTKKCRVGGNGGKADKKHHHSDTKF